jgi:hypothetical protein
MGLNKKYNEGTYAAAAEELGYTALDPYNGITFKINHICHSCNNICKRQPRQVLNGIGCRHCYQLRVRKPIEQVKQSLLPGKWEILNDNEYKNSYLSMHFKHQCGHIVKSSLEVILRTDGHRKRCPICTPYKVREKTWAKPIEQNGRKYSSTIEATCCEYLIGKFGLADIVLQKEYLPGDRRTADAYIKSIDTYVEVSTIGKDWYLERIYRKRALVKNFIFVSSLSQLFSMIK